MWNAHAAEWTEKKTHSQMNEWAYEVYMNNEPSERMNEHLRTGLS